MLIKDRREDIQNAQSQVRSLGYRCEYSGVPGIMFNPKAAAAEGPQQLRVLCEESGQTAFGDSPSKTIT